MIKIVKNTVQWMYIIEELDAEEIFGTYYEKELQKTNQTEFRAEQVIKTKADKLYVRCKGFGNLLNSWIKKGII